MKESLVDLLSQNPLFVAMAVYEPLRLPAADFISVLEFGQNCADHLVVELAWGSRTLVFF